MDGLGNINWWGFSPSLDLLKLFNEHFCGQEEEEEEYINILLFNSGDQRHILETVASKRKYFPSKKTKIRVYVYEKMLELYARDFLLMSIALEHPSRRGVQEKTELFLEIFGNLMVRDYTSRAIQTKSNEFVKLITDLSALEKSRLGIFDFGMLKYKERDYLECVFKHWRAANSTTSFAARQCWDARLRAYFGAHRYDSRSNAYDWDFSMKLADRPHGSIVNNRSYAKWRETGVGFELRDVDYDVPNVTLASGMVFNNPLSGDKSSRRGYFGDIIVGPFISYGISSSNEEFYKKQNDIYRYSSTDISKSNVNKLMEAFLELGGFESNSDNETNDDDYLQIDEVEIKFLPLSVLQDFLAKPKYDNFFHVVYFSNTGAVSMRKELTKILKPNALVVFETAKFMLEMKPDQINSFSERLKQIATECGLLDLNKNEVINHHQKDRLIKIEQNDYFIFKFVLNNNN